MHTIIKTTTRKFGHIDSTQYTLKISNPEAIVDKTLGQLMITELAHKTSADNYPALIFIPGMFTSRKFWLSDSGVGLAAFLFDKGFSCFLIDRRGIGESTKKQPNITYDNFWQHDLPALQSFVTAQGHPKAFWIGHSFGGVAFTLSLAKLHMNQLRIAGLVTFSSQLTVGKRALNPPISWLTYPIITLLGYLPAKLAGLGPEDESAGVIKDLYTLVSWSKGRPNPYSQPFWQGFNEIDVPILSFASIGDTVDPYRGCKIYYDALSSTHKQFILLGKKFQHIMNYTHAGMIISKPAQKEIWPYLHTWLKNKDIAGYRGHQ